jgi:Photosynthesis affected mutant 68
MASKPKQAGDKKGDSKSESPKGFVAEKSETPRIPFERTPTRKKPTKQATTPKILPKTSAKSEKQRSNSPANAAFASIPESVSKRMAKRAALFCGIPTVLGMSTFVISYFIVSKGIYKLPPVAVLLVSLGFFGLGVIGLSYGAFSASWDEGRLGNWLGLGEFRTNFGRTIESWKAAQRKASQEN